MTNTQSVFASAIQHAIDSEFPASQPAPEHSTSRKGKSNLSIQQHFEIFDGDNPVIYDLLVAGAYEAVGEGHRKFSIAFIFERVRWKLPVETFGEDFKLNNNYRSRYVRKIEANEPGLAGFFKTRSLRSL